MSDDRLYELHSRAVKEFEAGPKFNWTLSFGCDAHDLPLLELTDVSETAEGWRSVVPPANFYFTHAQYYTDGIRHIIKELREKPTSNRALYSLIAQADIRTSGDKPIPSFMVMQCQISDDTLYCTCYFRALEVSRFLKINLEEIRQTLVEIHEGVPNFSRICLTVFAFRAYVDENRSPLRRPQLETMHDDELLVVLMDAASNPVRRLAEMLKDQREAVTAVAAEKLLTLKRILSNSSIPLSPTLKKPLLIDLLETAIRKANALSDLRSRGSHGAAVDAVTKAYQEAIDALVKQLDE